PATGSRPSPGTVLPITPGRRPPITWRWWRRSGRSRPSSGDRSCCTTWSVCPSTRSLVRRARPSEPSRPGSPAGGLLWQNSSARSRSKGAPMSTEHGDIRRRLEDLGAALGDLQLPGPDAARRRARQRSRRQAGGAVLGAVAAVAVGVISVGGLPAANTAPPAPAESPTGEPTIEPSDERLVLSVDDVEAGTGDGEP